MRTKVYKYIRSQHLDDFVRRGRVLFRNLTFFRASEDAARGDLLEGRHIDRPGGGVSITNLSTGQRMQGDFAFVNSVDTENIFVYCFSMKHDEELYRSFGADACVEITSITQFVRDCRQALRRKHSNLVICHGPVEYYSQKTAAEKCVKDPRNLPFFKPDRFASQAEYRIVVLPEAGPGIVQNIVRGEALPHTELPTGESPRTLCIRLRGKRQYMKVHCARSQG